MTTINFSKNPLSDKTVEITKQTPLNATIKYGNQTNLPDHEERNAIIVSVDSGEIFAGTGATSPLKKIGDVSVLATIDNFPVIGVLEKIYISKETNSSYFWDGTEYQSLVGGGSGSSPVNTTRINEFPSVAEFPAEGVAKSLYIDLATNSVYRFDTAGSRYIKLTSGSVDLSGYRLKADKIAEGDLAPALASKVNAQPDLSSYAKAADVRAKADKIAESDLAPQLAIKVNAVPDLSQFAKTTDVRTKAVAISATDLDAALLARVDAQPDLSSYAKATDVRAKTDAIQESDLDAVLAAKVNASGGTAPDLSAYAKTADVRAKNVAIAEADLDPALAGKINAVGTGGGITSINGKTGSSVTIGIPDIAGLQTDLSDKADVFQLDSKVDKVAGKGLSMNDFTDTEKTKLAGLTNYTHPASHVATMITEDNTHQFVTAADKTVWNAKQAALGFTPEDTAKKGAANGYAPLGSDGKVPSTYLPDSTGGGGNGTTWQTYEPTGSTNGDCIIIASGPGVSFSKTANAATITPPAGVKIKVARIRFSGAEIGSNTNCSIDYDTTLNASDWTNNIPPLYQAYVDAAGSRAQKATTANLNTNAHTMQFIGISSNTALQFVLHYSS